VAGLRVLELSHIVAGPSAGLLLADLGADTVRVERPDAGDPFRTSNPAMFAFFNRNKRAVAIDLKSPAGHEAFLRLADGADVVIDNFGPGVVERLGLSYQTLSSRNPGLIYLAIRGFMPGPYGSRPLLDELAQMMGGLAFMTGPTGRPLRAGASVVDMGAAAYGIIGVLVAIMQRQVTGLGQSITSGLFETVVYWNGQHMAEAAVSGRELVPFPERGQADRMGWGVYNLFETAEGRQIFVGITSDAQWQRFCREMGLTELGRDPRLSANSGRTMARDWLIPQLREHLRRYGLAELQQRLSAAEVPFAPVNRPDELAADTHLRQNGQLLEVPMPGHAPASLPRAPFTGGGGRALRRPAPGLGQHTREVLLEAGYTEPELRRMADGGVIRLGYPLAHDWGEE
jgi:crotonobetainyl-CoA:carnitine CoA-transferase CaiB-like acyl-CoA transferase